MDKVPSKPQNEEEYESDYQHLSKFLQDSYKLYLKHQARTQSGSHKPKEVARAQSRQSAFSSANELGEYFQELPPLPSAKNRQHETTTKLSFKATQLLYEILSDREAYEGQFLSNNSIDNIASLKQENQVNLLECLKFALTIKTLSPTQTKEFVGQFVNNVMQGEKLLNKQLNLENLGQFVPSKNLVEGLGQESSQDNNKQDDTQRTGKQQNGTNTEQIWSSNLQKTSSTSGKENDAGAINNNQQSQIRIERSKAKGAQAYAGNSVYLDVPNFQSTYQQNLTQYNNLNDSLDLNTQNLNYSSQNYGKAMQTNTSSFQRSQPNIHSKTKLDDSYNGTATINSSLKNFASSEREQLSKAKDPYTQTRPLQTANTTQESFQNKVQDSKQTQDPQRGQGFNQKIEELRKLNSKDRGKSAILRNESANKNAESLNDSTIDESKLASMPNFQKNKKNNKNKNSKNGNTNKSSTNDETDTSTENKFQGFRKPKLSMGYHIQADQNREDASSVEDPYLRAYQLQKQRSKQGPSGLGSATRSGQIFEDSMNNQNNQNQHNRGFLNSFNRVKKLLRNTNTSANSLRREDGQSVENEHRSHYAHDTANSQRHNQILEFLQSRKHGGQLDRTFDINSRVINSSVGYNHDENLQRNGNSRIHQSDTNLLNKKVSEPTSQLQLVRSTRKPGSMLRKLFNKKQNNQVSTPP